MTRKAKSIDHRLNLSAGTASVLVAISLVILKIWALSQTSALSVAASLADSALDLVISLSGLLAIIYSARPADEDHTFGHNSAEDIAALGQAALLTVSAAVIGWSAVRRLLNNDMDILTSETQGMLAMAASVLLTLALILWQRYVFRKTGSKVVHADSLHYLSDLIPGVGAIFALAASSFLALPQIDSVIALIAALILFGGAFRIGRQAINALMDRTASPETLATVNNILAKWPDVFGYHDLKTRTAGAKVFVQVHIELDGAQTLASAHRISRSLKAEIMRQIPNADVIIHQDLAKS